MDAQFSRSLPVGFCQRLESEWPARGTSIIDALKTGVPTVSIRTNPMKWTTDCQIPDGWRPEPIPWCDEGFYLGERPIFTLDPLMHAGAYYVQDASSQILDHVLKQIGTFNLGLDLCAAPGGKSQILSKHLTPGGHLMCNEVNRIRVSILEETLTKWGNPRISIWNWDAQGFGQSEFRYDLILVDAPCSGEGLFRKDAAAVTRWSPEHVASCARLQQSIINDILPCLAPGGVIIYATCTLATQENEHAWRYLLKHDLEPVLLQLPAHWGWTDASELDPDLPEGAAFRMLPDQGRGEAFFFCCFRKKPSEIVPLTAHSFKTTNSAVVSMGLETVDPKVLLKHSDVKFVKIKNQLWLVSDLVARTYKAYNWNKCLKPGMTLGGLYPNEFTAPSQESAFLSECSWDSFPSIDLNEREALWYLSGRDFSPGKMPEGHFIVRYKGLGLGWSRRHGRSMARSYPAGWRIKMKA